MNGLSVHIPLNQLMSVFGIAQRAPLRVEINGDEWPNE